MSTKLGNFILITQINISMVLQSHVIQSYLTIFSQVTVKMFWLTVPFLLLISHNKQGQQFSFWLRKTEELNLAAPLDTYYAWDQILIGIRERKNFLISSCFQKNVQYEVWKYVFQIIKYFMLFIAIILHSMISFLIKL